MQCLIVGYFQCFCPSQNFHHDESGELEVGVPGSLPEGHLVGEAGDEVGDVGWVGMDRCNLTTYNV